MTKKKQIKKWEIVDSEPKTPTVPFDTIAETTLIIARKGKKAYNIEILWVDQTLVFVCINMWSYSIKNIRTSKSLSEFKDYLHSLLTTGYTLHKYVTWDDALEDLGITIPKKYART